MENTYKLELTLSEVNYILKVLSRQPFEEVYALIHKLHQQAAPQQVEASDDGDAENG